MVNACIEQWRAVLPQGRIRTGAETASYQQNCLSIERRILAVLQPENEDEILGIVHIANRFRVPLYSISTGHNWGYGTSLPPVDDCAILDLSRMNRIVDFDEELGLITLEPGVTQKQLLDYLTQRRLDFYVPTTGAGPSASIVGNALERGFGMTPQEDHFRAVTCVRAVLGDGSIYQSPFTDMGSKNAGVWKWGIGPYLDGLFAQGNMGIVTALQIALTAKPEHTETYLFTLKKNVSLEQMMEHCRMLLTDMRGTLGGMKFLNQAQLQSTIAGEEVGLRLPNDFAWMGVGVFRCRKTMVGSIRNEIRRTLKAQSSKLVFINDARNRYSSKLVSKIPGKIGMALRNQIQRAMHLMDIMNGIPRGLELRLVYKFVPQPEGLPEDPIRDGVGILWYAPVLPMKPALISAMVTMIEEVLAAHGFPKTVSLTTIDEKCAIGVIPIIYKRPDDAQKAHRCFHELWQRGNALGCPPYRINIEAMPQLTGDCASTYWKSVSDIKNALDPNHILAPGRYAPVKA